MEDYLDSVSGQFAQQENYFPDAAVASALKTLSQVKGTDVALMLHILSGLEESEREALIRFYVNGQTVDQICAEMNLSEVEVRLIKSRVKAQFAELRSQRAITGDPNQRKQAVKDMLAFAEERDFTLGEGLKLRDLIHEGHKY